MAVSFPITPPTSFSEGNKFVRLNGKMFKYEVPFFKVSREGAYPFRHALFNIDSFPDDFMFQITQNEFESLRLQIVTSKGKRG